MGLGIKNDELIMELYDLAIKLVSIDEEGIAMLCEILTNPSDTDDESAFVAMIDWLKNNQSKKSIDAFREATRICMSLFADDSE